MIVTLTTDDMQKRKNDVKARTTLLLALPNEHQLWFIKHKTAQELWAAILKTFDGNEATKKTKKNLLADDLNQKFLTSLPPEWLIHMIVWRNKSDLDTMSLDDLYNHLKVYESEVHKKSESNSYNMAFISLAKHNNENEEVNTASVFTASTNVSTASANIRAANHMEEMDIKWNMALLSMRADRFWKKITIQGTDVARFDKSKVECFNYHKMGHFARKCRAPKSQDRGMRDNYRQGSKVEEQTRKTLMAIDRDLDSLLESQRLNKNKEGLRYSDVPPLPAQVYSPPKKDLSWTGLSEFDDDTITDYSRPAPTIESLPDDAQNRNPSITKTEASPSTISPKPFIKFVRATDRSTKTKTAKVETAKPTVKYAVMYSKPSKSSKVRGNQRNWNNLKSHQLGANFVMKKKACYNCGLTILLMTVVNGKKGGHQDHIIILIRVSHPDLLFTDLIDQQ
nr:hypothetical protein [Tanacetum cinerariifolium]